MPPVETRVIATAYQLRYLVLSGSLQVRQPLYNSSVARWRVYEKQMAFLHQRLQPLIAEYEQLLQWHVENHKADDAQTLEAVNASAAYADTQLAAHDEATIDSTDRSKDEL